MIVVSNSTPLISLAKINRINLLQKLFKEVLIPNAVYNEVAVQGQGGYIKTRFITNTMSLYFLQAQLDYGESEAIILAKEINADLLIMDEKKARNIAKLSEISVIGTIGVLQKAKDVGILNSIKMCLDEMIQSGIWLDEKLYESVLEQNNES